MDQLKRTLRFGAAVISCAVAARLGGDTGLLIDKGKKNSVITEVTLEESVTAPVEQGQKLGQLTIQSGEEILATVPLVAGEAVERLSWGDLFVKCLKRAAMAK